MVRMRRLERPMWLNRRTGKDREKQGRRQAILCNNFYEVSCQSCSSLNFRYATKCVACQTTGGLLGDWLHIFYTSSFMYTAGVDR